MSSQYLEFTDAEYQELDTFTFQETIEKSEQMRFYTLNEQEVDAYEKLLPKGRVSIAQRNKTKHEVSFIRDLYTKHIIETTTDYQLREPIFGQHFDWINPVYVSNDRTKADWNQYLINFREKGYYPRMMAQLPHPYLPSVEGAIYPIEFPTEFVNADGQKSLRALPTYISSKRVVHEDGTIDIVPVNMTNTSDELHFTGYYIQKRPYDIPNPLPEHPFLSKNEPTYIESTAPLRDVLPSMDAILTHAVPTTTDPYTEGNKFVKLYDIRLSDIPWSSWKSRFPPVDSEFTKKEQVSIPFVKRDTYAPSDKIIDAYKHPYHGGVSTREWLMRQEDGGLFVIKALMSTVINSGSVANLPVVGPTPEYPSSTIEECSLQGLQFQDFMMKGLLRRTWKLNKDKDDIRITCIPLEFVKQERARAGYNDREQWKETTGLDLITDYLKILKEYRNPAVVVKEKVEEKTESKPESPLHLEVVIVLQDENRDDRDKLKDIQLLLQPAILSNEVYTDENGLFVCCSHTLAILSGDLETDRRTFYDKWTVKSDAHRVCKFCGEHVIRIDDVDQDEYDQNGVLIKQRMVLDDKQQKVVSETAGLYVSKMSDLVKQFNQKDISENLCFQIISILQVLPKAVFVQELLSASRGIVGTIKKGKTEAQLSAYSSFFGGLGIALAIILLQTDPSLVPRRSFGPTPLKLSGYPRDTPDPNAEKYTIIDALISVIDKTYRGFPTSLEGPASPIIRTILTSPKKIRDNVVTALNNLFKLKTIDIKSLLEKAKLSSDKHVPEEPKLLIAPQVPPTEIGTIGSYHPCVSMTTSVLSSETPPRIHQPEVGLRPGLQPSELRKKVIPSVSEREEVENISKDNIRTRIDKGKTKEQKELINSAKIPITASVHTNLMLVSQLSDMFLMPTPIRNVDFQQNASELEDIGKGFIYETLTTIQPDPRKKADLSVLLSRDLGLYCLTTPYSVSLKITHSSRAMERNDFVKRLGKMTDEEREITSELLKRGLAPYVITNEDRARYAKQLEILNETLFETIEGTEETGEENPDDDIGVGVPQYNGSEEDNNDDNGDYGDLPSLDRVRDYEQPSLGDDGNND